MVQFEKSLVISTPYDAVYIEISILLASFINCLYIILQHVLEHGKPDERSDIIRKLTGQIVQMSQQKFASNVIEKCLTFGTLAERQALVTEMLGTTDENEPLQVCHLFVCILAL